MSHRLKLNKNVYKNNNKMRQVTITILTLVCHILAMAQTIVNPTFDKTDAYKFHVDKIEITEDTTFVYSTYYVYVGKSVNISPTTYLENISTGEKYFITKSEEVPVPPQERAIRNAGEYWIKMSFPSVQSAEKINLIENFGKEGFNIYGINLKENNNSYNNYSIEQAKSFSTKAGFFYAAKNYVNAIEAEEQAMFIIKYWCGRLNEMYDHSVYMLGHYYSMLEKYDKAEKYLKESIEVREAFYGKGQEPYVVSLTQLASCYMNQNKISMAINLYEQAINSLEDNSNQYNLSYTRVKSLLAQGYYTIGDIPKAIQYTEEVVKINKSLLGESDDEYILPLMNLAQYSMRFDLLKAEHAYQDLVSVIRLNNGKENPMYLSAINGLAQCYILRNKQKDALKLAREHEELTLKMYGENGTEIGYSLNLKSQIYASSDDYDKAIKYGLASLKTLKSILSIDAYSDGLFNIASYFAKKGDYAKAYTFADDAINAFKEDIIPEFAKLSEDQKYSFWKKRHFLFDSGYIHYIAHCKNDAYIGDLYNNALFFKGITLKDDISSKYTWENIKESLSDNEISVEFIASHEQDSIFCYYAVLVRKEYKFPKMFRLFDTNQFGELLTKGLTRHEIDIQLGNLIWGTLEEELIGITNIYFSPAGILLKIGIEYLPIDDEKVYEDKYNIYRLSSTTNLLQKKQHRQFNKAFLFGGLDYNEPFNVEQVLSSNKTRSGFDMLPNSYDEVSSISEILKNNNVRCKIFSGLDGTEYSFRMLEKEDFDILHFATHGENVEATDVEMMRDTNNLLFLKNSNNPKSFEYEKDVMSWSYLVMSGGNKLISRENNAISADDDILTANEIANMRFLHLDIVALSACKTALGQQGNDDSILGLQRGFKKAGANTILMSLGKVDDEATRILMVEFYRNLMSGKTKHQSLRDAQKYLRQVENGKYNDPKYWASFIMLDGLN